MQVSHSTAASFKWPFYSIFFLVLHANLVQMYFSWQSWQGRGGEDVDWGQGEPPTLYDTGVSYQVI